MSHAPVSAENTDCEGPAEDTVCVISNLAPGQEPEVPVSSLGSESGSDWSDDDEDFEEGSDEDEGPLPAVGFGEDVVGLDEDWSDEDADWDQDAGL